MSQSEDTNRDSNEDQFTSYQLYLIGGLVSGVIAWFGTPLFGLATVYFALKLYKNENKIIAAIGIAIIGVIAVLRWFVLIVQI